MGFWISIDNLAVYFGSLLVFNALTWGIIKAIDLIRSSNEY
jgi:hypothetical protein